MSPLSRREFLGATAASAATLAFPQVLRSATAGAVSGRKRLGMR